MQKRYNSVMTLCASIDHDEIEGKDITPEQVRARFVERLALIPDAELIESVGIEDTIETRGLVSTSKERGWSQMPD